MRIRRYASSIASQAAAAAAPPQVVCELNLSPWDITPFTPQSEFDFQLKIEDDYTLYPWSNVEEEWLNTTSQRYNEEEEEEDPKSLVTKKKTKAKKRKDDNYVRCVKTDGKTWQCKKRAQRGETLCQHHLVQLQAYYNKYYHSTKKPSKSSAGKARAGMATTVVANKKRNRGRVQTKPVDFYYYSGFGPSWGKKRGGEDEITEKQSQVVDGKNDEASSLSSPSLCTNQEQAASSPVVHVACDRDDVSVLSEYEDEDEDDEEEGNVGKKRIRKRVKARSLKSLF